MRLRWCLSTFCPHALDYGMGFRQVLAVGTFALAQDKALHPDAMPSTPASSQNRITCMMALKHMRAGEIQVRLVGKKAVPVIGLGYLIPRPSWIALCQ